MGKFTLRANPLADRIFPRLVDIEGSLIQAPFVPMMSERKRDRLRERATYDAAIQKKRETGNRR